MWIQTVVGLSSGNQSNGLNTAIKYPIARTWSSQHSSKWMINRLYCRRTVYKCTSFGRGEWERQYDTRNKKRARATETETQPCSISRNRAYSTVRKKLPKLWLSGREEIRNTNKRKGEAKTCAHWLQCISPPRYYGLCWYRSTEVRVQYSKDLILQHQNRLRTTCTPLFS